MTEIFDSRADLIIEPQKCATATTLEGHHGT